MSSCRSFDILSLEYSDKDFDSKLSRYFFSSSIKHRINLNGTAGKLKVERLKVES